MTVSWEASLSDGIIWITGYTATAAPGGATCAAVGRSSCIVEGLTNGKAYTFTVVASSHLGQSVRSDPSAPVTPLSPPGKPTNVVVVLSSSRATISWSPPALNGNAPVTGYLVEAYPRNGGDGFSCTTTGAPTCSLTGLKNGTEYVVTVLTLSDVAPGFSSDPVYVTPGAGPPPKVPGKPTGVVASPRVGEASVTFSAPASNGSPIAGYVLTAIPGGRQAWCPGPPCTFYPLTNDKTYTITVAAENGVGRGPVSDPSNPVTPSSHPGAPTGVTAVPHDRSVAVSWKAPSWAGTWGIDSYRVVVSPAVPGCTTTKLSCTVTGLTNGTPYTFAVRAENDDGDPSPLSPSVGPVIPRAGSTYFPLVPNRLVDTARALGLKGHVLSHVAATFQVTGRAAADSTRNVPAGATAVTGVLTVTQATAKGWLALTPLPSNSPTTSTLNFPAADSRATGVTVPLGSGGKLSVTYGAVAGATADVYFDVTGYFLAGMTGATYMTVTPNRLVDSRPAAKLGLASGLVAGTPKTFQVTGRAPGSTAKNIPANAIAVTGTLTVTAQTNNGYLYLGPSALAVPTTGSL